MSTPFETNFDDSGDDTIHASHVIQYAEPIQELESGAALFRVASNDSGAYSVDFTALANPNGHRITSLTQGQMIVFKASHNSPASATLKVLLEPSGSASHPLTMGDTQVGANDILQNQMVIVVYNATTTPRFDVIGIASGGALSELEDVTFTSLATGQLLRYNGTAWVNATLAAGDLPTGIDAAKVGSGAVSNAEFGYLDGVTSSIQTQLNNKEDKAAKGVASGYASLDATGKVPVSQLPSSGGASTLDDLTDVTISSPSTGQVLRYTGSAWANGAPAAGDLPSGIDAAKVGSGTVSNAEFGYLDGVTSSIQTQLNGKAASSHTHTISDVTNLETSLDAKQNTSAKNAANGYAGLDAGSKLSSAQMSEVMPLNGLSDVTITSPATGHTVRYNGTSWVNAAPAAGDVPSGIDAAKVGSGTVNNTEFGYLDGVTSSIQTQLNNKEDKSAKGSANGYASLDATGKVPSAQLPSAGSHNHAAGDITSGTFPIARGGTGATSASAARTNLGVPGGSGTTGYVCFWSGANSLTSSRSVPKLSSPPIVGMAGPILYWNPSNDQLFAQYSRAVQKKDIQKLSTSIDDLMLWRAVEFTWKDAFGGQEDIGLISEEVASLCPRAAFYDQAWEQIDEVTGEYTVNEDGTPKKLSGDMVPAGVKYEKAWIPMLAAVQDFYRKYLSEVAELRARLSALEGARG